MSEPLRIFIGYDSREPVAYHVLAHSILTRAREPVAIVPLVQAQLRAQGLYTRERGLTESTEFSMTRFLVPHLCGYEGHALFLDCDVLCQVPIEDILLDAPQRGAVAVCHHDYVPKTATKMEGQAQTAYPRKNWSSVMLFSNPHCRALTPEYVNTASGLALHRFQWLRDDEVGALPLDWNWLVGEYALNPMAKLLHFTLGGPWFRDYEKCDHANLWRDEYDRMTAPCAASPWAREAWLQRGPV